MEYRQLGQAIIDFSSEALFIYCPCRPAETRPTIVCLSRASLQTRPPNRPYQIFSMAVTGISLYTACNIT